MNVTVSSTEAQERLPSELLTFVVVDVRGYTRFTIEQGDEAAARLAVRFAEITESLVDGHQGRVVELRGDEALCVFPSARSALRASVALQDRFARAVESDPSLPLRVGIGLDAGEAIPVKDGYRGGALNLAARLCGLAGAGEVLASETVIGLARKTDGLAFVDRGEVTLKGLPRPVRVIQITPEGERTEALSPLQSRLAAHPTNLPDDSTPFVGREREIAQIASLLQQPAVRLVTLTGPGGTGKTRLALQAGSTLLYAFRHGVFVVPLASLSDPALVPSAIADALGVKEEGGTALLTTLSRHLNDKHLLLVLDTVEHLPAVSSVVASLLDTCRELHILATGRIPLHLSREHEYAVPPLSVPAPAGTAEVRDLMRYEAVALFVERARAVKAGFELTGESAPAVAEICRRLDGLPLALELAAARVKLFPPPALLQRLSSRLTLLTGGARDLPARQQTLRGAIDWSYSLLSSREQALLARLSVFAGGCTLEAAEAVCGTEGEADLLEDLASLVDKSLLRQEGADEPRFLLLDTIREYAAEKLTGRAEDESIHRLHTGYFLTLAEEAEGAMLGAAQLGECLDRLETEHDNLRQALSRLLTAGQWEEALRLAGSLFPFWNARGHWSEGRRWLEHALTGEAQVAGAIRAKALAAAGGIVGARHGDFSTARPLLEEALALYRRLDDPVRTALTLSQLANNAYQQGDSAWRRFYAECLSLVRKLDDRTTPAAILTNLALLAYHEGDTDEAGKLYEEALHLSRRAGHTLYASMALSWLARMAFDQGEYREAKNLIREGLDLGGRRRYTLPIMLCMDTLAGVAVAEGKAELAARMYGAVEALQRTSGGRLLPQILARRRPLLEAGRDRIGGRAWGAAWQEGEAMSLDEAIAHALNETERRAISRSVPPPPRPSGLGGP